MKRLLMIMVLTPMLFSNGLGQSANDLKYVILKYPREENVYDRPSLKEGKYIGYIPGRDSIYSAVAIKNTDSFSTSVFYFINFVKDRYGLISSGYLINRSGSSNIIYGNPSEIMVDDTGAVKERNDKLIFYLNTIKEAKEKSVRDQRMKEEKEEELKYQILSDSLDNLYLKYYGKYSLLIKSWDWGYGNEYSRAPNVSFEVKNVTKKKVKYIWVTMIAKDAVGGRLTSYGQSAITLKMIGPINPLGEASYEFENVFYSKVINTMVINQIKILYFDGTTKILTGNNIAILPNEDN